MKKIGDFGVSKRNGSQNEDSVGTLFWMAPELLGELLGVSSSPDSLADAYRLPLSLLSLSLFIFLWNLFFDSFCWMGLIEQTVMEFYCGKSFLAKKTPILT